ncbi:MAG: isoprenylcysteine carboxylmethyltransferase family protein [Verrucomicrobiota bacterium JB024]|nr:isoprenylcysteine carboxylmethyltransferase family protein [Verrucomicrobiota bacterium JB024]
MIASRFAQHRIFFTRTALVLAVLPLLFSSSFWDPLSRLFSESLFALGVALAGVGVIGRVWCFSYISGRKQSQLITQGPYSLMRNPLYFFTMIGAVGIAFTSEMLLPPLVVMTLFAVSYPSVIRQEERALRRVHGAAFDRYCETTPRFWPSFSNYDEPDEVLLNPRAFRRGLQDVIWFIVACGTFEILEGLHESGLLPVFLQVP